MIERKRNITEKKQSRLSRWGFILSAVGMANVWGFPAKMGSNGGGAVGWLPLAGPMYIAIGYAVILYCVALFLQVAF